MPSGHPHQRTPPQLTDRSRSLRRFSTFPERLVWSLVRTRSLGGLRFRRQHVIDPFIVDFYCPAARLVVEIGGETHDGREDEDRQRTRYRQAQGLQILLLTNDEVVSDGDAVAHALLAAAQRPSHHRPGGTISACTLPPAPFQPGGLVAL